MDIIALRRVDVPDYEPVFSFSINGRELADILRAHGCEDCELTLWSVGCHQGCTVFAQQQGTQPERQIVMICGCGVLGCSSTSVSVTRRDKTVVWSEFATDGPSRIPELDNAGPFEFDAEHYDTLLAEGRRLAREEMAKQRAFDEEYRKQRDAEAARQSEAKPSGVVCQPAESA